MPELTDHGQPEYQRCTTSFPQRTCQYKHSIYAAILTKENVSIEAVTHHERAFFVYVESVKSRALAQL